MLTTADGLLIETKRAIQEKITVLSENIVSGHLDQNTYQKNCGHLYGLRDAEIIMVEVLAKLNGKREG